MSGMITRVADAIADAEVGYNMTLVRLVDGISTYSLRYDDGETLEFGSLGECYEHINSKKRAAQARAAIEAMREPTPEMVSAGMGEVPEDGSEYEDVEDAWRAMIDAALSQDTHSLPPPQAQAANAGGQE